MPIYVEELLFADTEVACPSCQTTRITKQWSVPARPAGARSPAGSSECDAGLPPSGCCGGGCHQH